MGDCKKWKAQLMVDPATPSFEDWVGTAMRNHADEAPIAVDVDTLLLCTRPSQKATRYTKMKAYGNHFKVQDESSSRMQTYNSGVASMFDVPTEDARDVLENYVGVLKDKLKLDYDRCAIR
jgi:hypothetical protein